MNIGMMGMGNKNMEFSMGEHQNMMPGIGNLLGNLQGGTGMNAGMPIVGQFPGLNMNQESKGFGFQNSNPIIKQDILKQEPVQSNIQPQFQSQTNVFKYAAELQELKELGFEMDEEIIKKTLEMYNGDKDASMNSLLGE